MTDPMTVRRTHDEQSPGPSCFTVTAEKSLQLSYYINFVSFLIVLFARSRTTIDSLQVLSLMAQKQDRVYARGRSKSVTLSARLVIGYDDEHDPEYVPQGTTTPSRDARATRPTPTKVASGVVTASECDEEHTLINTPYGSATHEEGVSGWLGVLLPEEASKSAEVPALATSAQSPSSDEADSPDSTPGSPTGSLTEVANQPNDGVSTGNIKHRLEWTARSLGSYSEELVREFYASYVDTLKSYIDRWATPAKQAPLEHVPVRGIQVDISLPTVHRYLYIEDVDANRIPLIAEFHYRWEIVNDFQFSREPSLSETTKRWMALHFSIDAEGADWVTVPKGAIKKANLTFTAKFLWLIIRHYMSLMVADNIVTWDHAVLMAAMIVGFEVDFVWLLQEVMHERDLKVTNTYPFSCMIVSLYRSASVPIWHIDQLKTPLGTVDISLIKDETNELSPCRGPRQELPPLGSSTAPRSYCLAPFTALVPLARVQKLEAQIPKLLHHIQPWMKRSIAEEEERLESKMVQHTERKMAESLLRTVMAALFATFEIPPPPLQEHSKRHKGREEDEARARKKEHRDMEVARRSSLADEEARRIRAVESLAGASSSRDVAIAGGTSYSVVADEDTTEGIETTEVVDSGEPNPLAC
ncbi:hypothetical protein EJD97_006518 [Solanum chilense]|uniref:Putative plant transposon protein domain-containing protein n=1 Tax=Solanum chilense TaxID=4083 RepID=A0A6N2BQN3_SOLCI|nr:hypothetical protein EJD97_006518 [Solanum chilense]